MVLLPLLGILALAVRLECGPPVLSRRWRVGRRGAAFQLLEFATARTGDASRVGPVGHVLRGTSLDELPQLWNVLRGDVSLVGRCAEPASSLVEPRNHHETDRTRDDDVCLASWSLWLDLRILTRTAIEVVRRDREATSR